MFKKKEKDVRLVVPDELPPSSERVENESLSIGNSGSTAAEATITLAGTDRPVEYAGFIRRAFALFFDQAIVIVSQWILLIPSALTIVYDGTWGWMLFGLSFLCILVLQYWIYTAFFEHSRWQATPGKFLVGLKVTDLKGNPLTFWKSSLRLLIHRHLFQEDIVGVRILLPDLDDIRHLISVIPGDTNRACIRGFRNLLPLDTIEIAHVKSLHDAWLKPIQVSPCGLYWECHNADTSVGCTDFRVADT